MLQSSFDLLQGLYRIAGGTDDTVCLQYPLCLSLLASKKVDVLPLVTHRLGFSEEEVVKGFDTALRSAETKAIKVMFNL